MLARGRRRKGIVRWALLAVLLGGAGVGVYVWQERASRPEPIRFELVSVERGRLLETVTATGKLNPVDAVELGAEVTGRLVSVDVDVNDTVQQGQIVAKIDTEQLEARMRESRAQLQSALASQESAKASLDEAELTAQRVAALFERGLASKQEHETAQSTVARTKANLSAAAAQITVARAGVSSTQSALSKAVIVAPISGIVLSRSVETGQTVTAGFQTPVLFTLARDLTRLELKVEVDEADIGKVAEGQVAHFSVDAYPGRTFESQLVKLHNMPTSAEGNATSTVVTYTAVLTVDNGERLLRPGMTATATITTRTLEDELLVPNLALRFSPPREGSQRSFMPIPGLGGPSAPPGARGGSGQRPPTAGASRARDRVWLPAAEGPKPLPVEVIGTDGIRSAVKPVGANDALVAGAQIVVDVIQGAKR